MKGTQYQPKYHHRHHAWAWGKGFDKGCLIDQLQKSPSEPSFPVALILEDICLGQL
jgi:hypothetical protein